MVRMCICSLSELFELEQKQFASTERGLCTSSLKGLPLSDKYRAQNCILHQLHVQDHGFRE
jgi:hypothetical protein